MLRSTRQGAALHAAAALALVTSFVTVGCGSDDSHGTERLATNRAAIVGGVPSTTEDDFIVFVSHSGDPSFTCGGTLVAPNLVVTAKHCVYAFTQGESFCDATGNPQSGSLGGYITMPIPLSDLGFFRGPDGKKRALDDLEPPEARAVKVIDDKTATLCSHDIAYVVLDKPMTGLPIGKLRLGKRPQPDELIAVSGWGQVEDRTATKFRQRRTGVTIQRVGLPIAPPGATGTLGPRTFETGPGACSGDSGSPGFDLQTGAIFGVVARGLNLDPLDPISPCRPPTVSVAFVAVNDYPAELRAAFTAAGAQPWLEGRGQPGYLRFADECSADLECEGGRCVGATTTTKGTCNVDCVKPVGGVVGTCPDGFVCASTTGVCETRPPPPVASPTDPVSARPPPPPEDSSASGCTSSPRASNGSWSWIVGACMFLALRLRTGRRSRGLSV